MSLSENEARAYLARELSVSRETLHQLDSYVQLLLRWQSRINLIAPSTVGEVWARHILDSAQLNALAGPVEKWVDLGAGGGLPGLVIAILRRDQPRFRMHLVESNHKKAAFLREAARVAGVPATVHCQRIEDFKAVTAIGRIDVVSARALADLSQLLDYADDMLAAGAKGLFMKGASAASELTASQKFWKISATVAPSLTDPAARIVVVNSAERLSNHSKALPDAD